MKKVVVIGGGITGLSTLFYLEKMLENRSLSFELTLVEKENVLGGKIRTKKRGEFIIETGADSMVARHESVQRLVAELNLEKDAVYNATGISYIYTNNELHPIPQETVFGIPINEEALNNCTLLSEEGKKRVLQEPEIQSDSFTLESSIGEFLTYFLGEEIVKKQIGPVLSGVYSGSLDELTLATTMPYLLEYKKKYGSIIKGLRENREMFLSSANKKFMSFRNGLSAIIDELASQLKQTSILKGIEAKSIAKNGAKYDIYFSDGRKIAADYIVLTTPHQVSQSILNHDELHPLFNKLTNSSLFSIYLGYDLNDQVLPKDGTGYITSNNCDVHCNACTWTSRKWKHTSANGNFLTRLFYKSSNPIYKEMEKMTEDELVKIAMSDIEKSLQITARPKVVEITKWVEAMPNYHLEHKKAIDSLEMKMKELYPNVILAGCSYYGVGIGACIENGKENAKLIIGE